MVNKWLQSARSCLYPPTCAMCGCASDTQLDLCTECHDALPHNSSACSQCALPLDGTSDKTLCGQCLNSTHSFDNTFSLFQYSNPVDHFIQSLKFNGKLRFANLLGNLLADALSDRPPESLPELIIPVPLHSSRQRERGFNQAVEIARPVSRALNIPLNYSGCIRSRPTIAQSTLNKSERRSNIRGAFAVKRKINIKNVAILDDVITTGQTVNELARTLKQHGVQNIEAWSIARAE
ncbi:MAG: ComF family protein [Gammaproteobacteria bacterium]|nr:ComF family protein [Gammaproteobacteria bacterium]